MNWYSSMFLGLTFLFTTKNSFLILLTGMLYQTQIKLHKELAISSLLLGATHGISHFLYDNNMSLTQKISGGILLIMMFLLVFTGILFTFLNKYFNSFILIHKIFFSTLLVAAFFHGAYNVFYFGAFWLWFDLILRIIIAFRNAKYLTNLRMDTIDDKYIILTFNKNEKFTFQESQFCWLYIPSISKTHLHPFSICSTNNENEVKFIVKKFDNFTKLLLEKAKKGEDFKIYIDGPYGNIMVDIWDEKQDNIILIAGGVGLTSILPLTKFFLNKLKKKKIKKILLYWITRDTSLHNEIKDLLKIENDESLFRIHCYLTQDNKDFEGFNKGRPDWKEQFGLIRNFAITKNFKKVVVFVCGPKNLTNEIVSKITSLSDNELKFDYNYRDSNPLYL